MTRYAPTPSTADCSVNRNTFEIAPRPPAASLARRFPVIFGCDVIYEKRNHAPILNLLETMLAFDGQAWITDPGRHQADAFLELLRSSPFDVEHRQLPREPYPGRPAGQTDLWIVRWRSTAPGAASP